MNYTPNLNLKKPAKTDPVLIDDLNDNMDILDQEVQDIRDTINQEIPAIEAALNAHVANTNNPHNVTAEQVGAVSKSGDIMTGPLRVGGLVIRDLNSTTGDSPKWWKLVRIQNYNPINALENVNFSGQMIVQSDFGRTADKQGIYTFSFGVREGENNINIKPVLFTAGDAKPIGRNTPRFQIWRDTDGWHYLYFQQPLYSKFCQFIYSYNGNKEYWTEEDPQQVSGLTLVWDSATDPVQDIYVGTNKVWHAGNIKSALNASGNAPIYACRAWVNFNGKNDPPTIRASGNVSSVTKNGTGNYTVNFIAPMPHTNYSATANYTYTNSASGGYNDGQASPFGYQANSVRILVADGSGNPRNGEIVTVSIHC